MTPAQRYAWHKEYGLCIDCIELATHGLLCEVHHEHRRVRGTDKFARYRQLGKCFICGRPHHRNGRYCEYCLLVQKERSDRAAANGVCKHCLNKPSVDGVTLCQRCLDVSRSCDQRRRIKNRKIKEEPLSKPVQVGQHWQYSPRFRKFRFGKGL